MPPWPSHILWGLAGIKSASADPSWYRDATMGHQLLTSEKSDYRNKTPGFAAAHQQTLATRLENSLGITA